MQIQRLKTEVNELKILQKKKSKKSFINQFMDEACLSKKNRVGTILLNSISIEKNFPHTKN